MSALMIVGRPFEGGVQDLRNDPLVGPALTRMIADHDPRVSTNSAGIVWFGVVIGANAALSGARRLLRIDPASLAPTEDEAERARGIVESLPTEILHSPRLLPFGTWAVGSDW